MVVVIEELERARIRADIPENNDPARVARSSRVIGRVSHDANDTADHTRPCGMAQQIIGRRQLGEASAIASTSTS
jgi:hypothetical protein